jgi:hypothetical protein
MSNRARLLRTTGWLVLLAGTSAAPLGAQRSAGRGCFGGEGGGMALSGRVTLAYALTYDSAGARLDAAILARGQPGWDRGARGRGPLPHTMPGEPGDRPPMLAGATADTFALLYDRANDVVWVGGRRVPLRGANIVLLDRADEVGGPPVVRPPLRADLTLPVSDQCEPPRTREAHEARVAAIRAALLRHAEVRAFLAP